MASGSYPSPTSQKAVDHLKEFGGRVRLWNASCFRSGKLNGEHWEFYCLDVEAGVLSKCFSSKVTSVICQLHASVFSMRLHFGAHKRAVLYVHCKMWYSGVKQCARNGSLITILLHIWDLVLFFSAWVPTFCPVNLPAMLHSILYNNTEADHIKPTEITPDNSSSIVLSYRCCPSPVWLCLMGFCTGAKQ